jgi:hypothetical protein
MTADWFDVGGVVVLSLEYLTIGMLAGPLGSACLGGGV